MACTIIGVLGKAGAGKSTFAARLVDAHDFAEVGFADPLRRMAAAIDPIVGTMAPVFGGVGAARVHYTQAVERLGYAGAKRTFPEMRRFLQRLGTEAGREHLGPDVWVDAAMHTVRSLPGPVVMADVRFPNEADAILRSGGTLMRVIRPGLPDTGDHPSEVALDDFPVTFTLINEGTPEDLHYAADMIAARVEPC